jgi:hypothetical protein
LLGAVELVGVVVDQEVRQQTEPVGDDPGILAEDANAEGVKSPHHQAGGGALPDQALDSVAHLARGLVGERDREDLLGQDAAFLNEVGDAMGEDACLAGPWTGYDEDRSVDRLDGESLVGIEPLEQFGCLVDHRQSCGTLAAGRSPPLGVERSLAPASAPNVRWQRFGANPC